MRPLFATLVVAALLSPLFLACDTRDRPRDAEGAVVEDTTIPTAPRKEPGPRWSGGDVAVVHQLIDADARCVPSTPLVTPPTPLGPLTPSTTLVGLESLCQQLAYVWLELEGVRVPALHTRLGQMSVLIEMTDTTGSAGIRRVSTHSTVARTTDGIGPGVPFERVKAAWPDVRIVMGEGAFATSAVNPGISLGLTVPEGAGLNGFVHASRTGDLSRLPAGIIVSHVLLTSWGEEAREETRADSVLSDPDTTEQ